MANLRSVLRTLLMLLVALTIAADLSAAVAQQRVGADSTRADSALVRQQADRDAIHADSTHSKNPAYRWKTWKDLSRAIAIRALDGPADILEKAEIVEDRRDDLLLEQEILQVQLNESKHRHQSLEIQLEVLEDLAEVKRGGDFELQQRLHNLRENIRKNERGIQGFAASLKEMEKELKRLADLVKEYKARAEDLQRYEEKDR